ncbi:unnamed protein product [Mytilus edulis]|uniref:Reverse transcriptase domain-containing protein n=1 Tax=Mytilus edulis TaxID=6550 RepID=A0A8S3VN36_MYTED|nr:unnamed protein product [Mytilus edulis]
METEGKQADHPFRKQLKAEKEKSPQSAKKEHAEDRLNLYQQIIDNPSTDLFYKLINRNRSKPRTNSTGIDIEGELEFNPAIQRKAFAKYYEDLSKGLCPLIASLIISECKCERKNNTLYLATVDVQSAFDVVQHLILHDKTLDRNIHPDLWFVIKDLYSGLTSKVKWQGELSDSFNILQGVRQGGILSTHLYKIFVEDLLLCRIRENATGFSLGDIYCERLPVLTTSPLKL